MDIRFPSPPGTASGAHLSRRTALLGAAAALMAGGARAQVLRTEDIVQAEILRGWRNADGTRMAALRLRLAPGWKTYWRMPGAAGIAPTFNWSGSRNVADLRLHWPRPEIFDQSGLLGLGYSDSLVLPVEIRPQGPGRVTLAVAMDIGVCNEICVPVTLRLNGTLAGDGAPDAAIAAALARRPETAAEARVGGAHCAVAPTALGLDLQTRVTVAPLGGREVVVMELPDSDLWISHGATRRHGGEITAQAGIQSLTGRPVTFNRGALRISVIAETRMVEIEGCQAG